jgi:hypothetical protein
MNVGETPTNSDKRNRFRNAEVEGSTPFRSTLRKLCRNKSFCYLPAFGSAAFLRSAKPYVRFWRSNHDAHADSLLVKAESTPTAAQVARACDTRRSRTRRSPASPRRT